MERDKQTIAGKGGKIGRARHQEDIFLLGAYDDFNHVDDVWVLHCVGLCVVSRTVQKKCCIRYMGTRGHASEEYRCMYSSRFI